MTYKKIACIGDSFSSIKYGLSWPDLLSQRLNADLSRASSPGAGQAFYVEKCHDLAKDPTVDLVVVQLTEPSRAVVGLRVWEEIQQGLRPHPIPAPQHYLDANHNNIYKDMGCYTMNVHNNEQWLKPLVGSNADAVDRFWLNQVAGTKFYDYQAVHSVLAMQSLCHAWNKPLILFSWFVPGEQFFVPGYEWLTTQLRLVPGHADAEVNRLQLAKTDCGHLATESWQQLFDSWLWPNMESLL
jgi:hypothetical protein